MNSFNSLANIILDNNDKNSRSSKDIWPDYLEKYEKKIIIVWLISGLFL